MPETAPPSLPRVVRSLGWVSLLTDASSDMIYPLLPAFLRTIGGGGAALGVMEGIAESIGALVKWRAGIASDRRGRRKPFVVTGYAIATLVRPLLALATAPLHVVLVRSVDRVGKGLRSAPRDAILGHAVPPEQRAAAYGYHRMMDNAGAVVGPLLAFLLARYAGFSMRMVFAAAIVPGLLAMAMLLFRVKEPAAPRLSSAPADAPIVPSAVEERQLRRYLAVVALFTLGASADSFLLLRITDLGLPAAWVPLVWLSLNASKSATNIPGGRTADKIGRRLALVLAWLVYAAAYLSFPFTSSIAVTWVLIVAYGAYYGLAEGAEKAIVADLAPRAHRGRAFGMLHAVTGLAILPANAIFGVLYAKHAALAFYSSAACAALAAVALFVMVPATVKPR